MNTRTQRHIIPTVLSLLLATTALLGATNTFTLTGSMNVPRRSHKTILLDNGLVLAVTGAFTNQDQNMAELYNPETGTWTLTGSTAVLHEGGSVTLLANGEVLLSGGDDPFNFFPPAFTAAAELYDPSSGRWIPTRSMTVARAYQAAVLLRNGEVLVAGGEDSNFSAIADAELYNPATGGWQPTASMHYARVRPVAELLANGTVLVAGGSTTTNGGINSSLTTSAEIYNPFTGEWTLIANTPTNAPHTIQQGALLANGDVLVVRAGFFDPGTATWTAMPPRLPIGIALIGPSTATPLNTGEVLLTGFESTYNDTPSENVTFLYDATTNGYTRAAGMTSTRFANAATLLPNGQVLVSGGYRHGVGFGTVYLSSAELYTP